MSVRTGGSAAGAGGATEPARARYGDRVIALHLLRHAHAGDPARWDGPDALRPLSAKGRAHAARLAALLAALDEPPDRVVSSPKVRARETAEPVAAALGLGLEIDERLAGGLDAGLLAALLDAGGERRRPCLVGHDPDLSLLLGSLVGSPALALRKGAIARVDLPGGVVRAGTGILRWLLVPELLARPGGD